ncbi:MAG TPA: hypothetical protein VJ353_02880, partial [Xanthobacteraceae bacterium]|nr:hypothetical protein [Xanthobacteraceae bacterium]
MTSDLLFVRAMIVSRQAGLRGQFRQAGASSRIPLEIVEAADATAACNSLGTGVDLIYLDGDLPAAEITQVVASRPAADRPPFTVLLGSPRTAGKVFETDGLAVKPLGTEAVQALIDRSVRVR